MGGVTGQVPVRLAVVGCGAAAERLHLPVLVGRDDRVVTTLVDPSEGRARDLAERFGVGETLTDHRALRDVDAAIVVTPNVFHAPITVDLVRSGIDVLVEKPVAATVAEVDDMIAATAETGAVVGVGMELRFSAVTRSAKALIDSGALGRVRSFTATAGVPFAWPVASSYILRRGASGGGALIDVGVHVVDLVLWWLGDVADLRYRDDAYGGVEADGLLELELASGVHGSVEVSRTRDLGHGITIRGERGDLDVALTEDRMRLSVSGHGGVDGAPAEETAGGRGDVLFSMAAEHDDFVAAVGSRTDPGVTLQEARRALAVITDAYGAREEWQLPWIRPTQVSS